MMCSAYSADGGVLRTESSSVSSCLVVFPQLSEFPNKVLGFSATEAQRRRLRSLEWVRLVRSVRRLGVRSRRRHPVWIWRRLCCTRAVVCDSEGDNQRTLSKN